MVETFPIQLACCSKEGRATYDHEYSTKQFPDRQHKRICFHHRFLFQAGPCSRQVLVPGSVCCCRNLDDGVTSELLGPGLLTRELLPIFKSFPAGARVVNVTSARLEYLKDEAWRQRLSDGSNLDQEALHNFISVYLEAVRAADPGGPEGWSSSYHTSKLALNAFTRIFAKDPALHTAGRTVYINSVHPGYVRTDMSPGGTISPAQGADTIVWIALLPAGGPNGGFFYRRKDYAW